MNNDFSMKLKTLMTQLDISNAQLARGLHVDPSLVSRWLKNGFGQRKADEYAAAVGQYIFKRPLTAENRAWLAAEIGDPLSEGDIARWLCPKTAYIEYQQPRPMLVNSFHDAVENQPETGSLISAVNGTETIVRLLHDELADIPVGSEISIYLSSEASSVAVERGIVRELSGAAETRKLNIAMVVQFANNSRMASRLIGAYMHMLVQGRLTLSIIQGTPQTFTIACNMIIGRRVALIITETQQNVTAVGTVVRDPSVVQEMQRSFENSKNYARPMMIAYNDSFARNIIEVFFEEYGVPGSLDVIKSGMNPMFMTVEQYGRVLREFNHPEDQYAWRYNEFCRFKAAMDEVLSHSRFREVLSLAKLREIAETGRCRMPSMYFMAAGTCCLDAQDCVNILDGYIRYLETIPDFQVVLLDDEQLFTANSCWHIKSNKHIMIHSWNIDEPMMVYSDQLMLIDEFQRHFEQLWQQTSAGVSKHRVIQTLSALRDQCRSKIGQ